MYVRLNFTAPGLAASRWWRKEVQAKHFIQGLQQRCTVFYNEESQNTAGSVTIMYCVLRWRIKNVAGSAWVAQGMLVLECVGRRNRSNGILPNSALPPFKQIDALWQLLSLQISHFLKQRFNILTVTMVKHNSFRMVLWWTSNGCERKLMMLGYLFFLFSDILHWWC